MKLLSCLVVLLALIPSLLADDFTTIDGDHYTHATVKMVEPDGIVISYTDGVRKLKFKNLPPSIGQQYGYNPQQAAQYESQVASEQQSAAATVQVAQAEHDKKISDLKEVLATAREQEEKKQQAEEARAEDQAKNEQLLKRLPDTFIRVIQVLDKGVLAERGNFMGSGDGIGDGSAASGVHWERNGGTIFIEGLGNVTDDSILEIKAAENGVYKYVSTEGVGKTIQKLTLVKVIKDKPPFF